MEEYKRPRPQHMRPSLDGFINGGTPVVRRSPRIPAVPNAASIVPQQRLMSRTQINRTAVPMAPKNSPANHRLPGIDMALQDAINPTHNPRKVVKRSKWRTVRRWTFRTVALMLVLLIAVGGYLFSQGFLNLHKVFKGGAATAAALQANVDPSLLKGEGSGRINILLLGIGGAGHDGADLTDTMMLASIDPVNHTAALLSVPRDLWVNIPNNGTMKINAAYEMGKFKYLGKITADNSNSKAIQAGFSSVDPIVEGVLGVPIDYNVLVDFQAFRQAVDTVGGVTIDVQNELYDPTMAWENNWNPVLAKPGVQTFDGKHALIYARSRETSSDFARGIRQRQVLLALKDKAMTLGVLSDPTKISGLMSAFGNNVQTDLSLSDAERLYSIVKDIGNSNVSSLDLDTAPNQFVTTGDIDGQSIVEPKAGLFDYSQIQGYVRSSLQDGYIKKENARVVVLNGTTAPGLATAKADELKQYGYNVTQTATAPTSGYQQTVLVDLTHGKDKYTKHYLEQRFNTTAVSTVPDQAIASSQADFILILGNDQTATLQN
ncbi:MAG TPA: LCP family protein [Candidatus Saccharimonadales bacterium]|nr:LCP family protein [Candidatus Saccharimonadales bacterium]